MKRIISVLLAIAMLFSCGVVAMAEEEAAATAVGAKEIDFLSRIGIMEADADPEATITRAEMAKIVMMCIGQGENLSPTDTPFTDVNASNEYSGYIQLANSAGIMVGNGDGKFNPNGNVTYNQVVKLLTHAIGYEAFAQTTGGYPGGYLITANNNGMLVGTTPSGEEAISHGVAAILIKNALDIDVYERLSYGDSYDYASKDGVTTLTKFFDIYQYQGVITANHYTSLTGTSSLKKDEIVFDGATVLKTGTSGAEDYLGFYVDIYVKVDKDARYNTVVAVYPKENAITVINGEDVMDRTSETLLVYLGEADEEELKIDTYAKLIYNGGAKVLTAAALKGNAGDITAIDNDDDGDADVLIVYNYRNVIVNNTKSADNIIYTKDEIETAWQRLEIDPESKDVKTTFVNKDGKNLTVADLVEWDVISIAISDNGDVIKAIVCNDVVEGTIETFDDDTITVGGTEYKYDASKVTTPTPADFGRKAVFHLDFVGRIAAIDFDGAISGMEYGYIKDGGDIGTGANRKVELEMLAGEELTMFELAKEVKLNGTKMADEAVFANAAIQTGGEIIQQLVMYSLDSEGKINKITTYVDDTTNTLSEQEKADTFTRDVTITGRSNVRYNKALKAYGGRYLVRENTKIFVIPNHTDTSREDLYAIWPASALDIYYWETVDIFDVDDDHIAGAVVLEYYDGIFSWSYGHHTGGIVTGVSRTLNDDGDVVEKFEIFNTAGKTVVLNNITLNSKAKAHAVATNVRYDAAGPNAHLFEADGKVKTALAMSDIKVGDFVQYSTNKINGETEQIRLVARLDDLDVRQNDINETSGYYDGSDQNYYFAYGKVTDIFRDGIEFTTFDEQTGEDVSKFILLAASKTLYHYDTAKNELTTITRSDLVEGEDMLFQYGSMLIDID